MSRNRSHMYARLDHQDAAKKARAERGRWVMAGLYPSSQSAATAARRVPHAEAIPAYAPAGAFEAYAAMHVDGWALWVRYVGGDGPVPELPDTMTVRVCDRGDGREYVGLQIITVTISALCPVCGGPRAFDAVEPHRFCEDGEWYTADVWGNLCGHVDTYADVLKEARGLVPGSHRLGTKGIKQGKGTGDTSQVDAGEHTPAVRLILDAADNQPGMHANTAVRLLEENGYAVAAELVRRRIRNQRGRMSAKQAAHYLTEAGAGERR